MKSQGLLRFGAAALVGAMVLVAPHIARAQAAACAAGETQQSFTFDTPGGQAPVYIWPDGSLVNSYSVGAGGPNAVTLTFTAVANWPFHAGSGFPHPHQQQTGNLNHTVGLRHIGNAINSLNSTFRLAFDRPVNKLRYVAADVDYTVAAVGQPPGWQDQIRVSVNGGTGPARMTSSGPYHTIDLLAGRATGATPFNCLQSDASCNLTIDFETPNITFTTMEYWTGPLNQGGEMVIGFNEFSWCLPPPPITAQPIPTLSQWGVILLAGLLALMAAVVLRRRSTF